MGIDEWIERERGNLRQQADKAVQEFWRIHKGKVAKGEKAGYGVRAKRRGNGNGGVVIEWYRMRFSRRAHEWIAYKETVPRRGGYRYTKRELTHMEPWEWAAAIDVEDIAEIVRRQNEALTKISYLAREYRKRQQALDAAIGDDVE